MSLFTPTSLILAAAVAGAAILALGLWAGRRQQAQPHTQSSSVIRPIAPPDAALLTTPPDTAAPRPSARSRLGRALANHPDPLIAVFKTAFWLAMPLPLIDHLRDTQESTIARVAWALTIIPHEVGHFICMPFGWVMHVAGGSIWQVLFYVLLGLYAFVFQRQVWIALVFWMISGHSLINLSVYIADAAERDLPLIFGLDKSHHDWWNLLDYYDALEYDNLIAAITRDTGAVIVVLTVIAGLITAWWQPRRWYMTRDVVVASQLEQLAHYRPRQRKRRS